MKTKKIFIIALAFLLLLSVPGLALDYLYPAEVERVVDGDTIIVSLSLGLDVVLEHQWIRLFDINAWEPKGETKEKGLEATKYLEERLSKGKIEIEIRPEWSKSKTGKDSFGRWIETGEVFDAMATDLGFSRADIKHIEQWQMETIELGEIISEWPEEEPPEEMTYQDGKIVRRPGSEGAMYLIKRKGQPIPTSPGGTYDVGLLEKCAFLDAETYHHYASMLGGGVEIDPGIWDAMSSGEPVPSLEPPPNNDYTWVRGVVTLNAGMPTVEEARALNFNVVLPFGWKGNEIHLERLAKGGMKIIANSSQLDHLGIKISPAFEAQYNVIAYYICDEPEFYHTPQAIINKINILRPQTKLPITCNFTDAFWFNWAPEYKMIGNWGDRYKEVFALLDFICFGTYFYRGGGLFQYEIDMAEVAIDKIREMKKSIIILAQGHEAEAHDITKPDIQYTDTHWRSRGCGVLWYAWNGYTYSVGDRGGPENEWYNIEIAKVNGGHWPA